MLSEPVPSASAQDADRVNQRFAGVGVALGLILWLNLFSMPLSVASAGVVGSHPRLGLFLGFVAMLTVVPGILWVARSAWGDGWRKSLPMGPVGPGLLAWTVLCVLSLLPVVLAWAMATDRLIGLAPLPDPFSSVGVLGVLIGAPVAEEVLFRGYGLARIKELAGERRALVFTALAFAVVHGSWVKLPGTLAVGLFLGWLVLRTGSLWPALLGHFTNNAAAFLLSHLDGPDGLATPPVPWRLILALGAGGLACLGLLGSPRVRNRISGLGVET